MSKCIFCDSSFSTSRALKNHQKTAKYCLEKRKIETSQFMCNQCNKEMSTKHRLSTHHQTCIPHREYIIEQKYEKQIKDLMDQIQQKDSQICKLQDKIENIAINAVTRPFEKETTIEIDDTLSESQFTVYDSDTDDEHKLTPLEVDKGYSIEHREEDGYINVTNLCKAGGKQFKAWKRIQRTKAFLEVLSKEVNIFTSNLIKVEQTSNVNKTTWVHPQVAINIAQWISPQFDVKVSGWVYEIMMTGKVDITNTKSYKELQEQNKIQDIKIQYLTKKYVKAQPRVQYEEKNVVYILTTKRMKKDRVYILGKATNLTNRLSTYNKSDEHQVVYYQSCGDEETMGCVENMVFQYLKKYREQANRERFILPKNMKIGYFSDCIKKSVEFFKK
uniref:KilA-N domain-containing protein n=1 Tax=viral metagenome TaxID=1070528 RepID=A0A6C0JMS7_9ZZZZ